MKDERKTKAQLIEELNTLRAALAEKEGMSVENPEGFIEVEGKQANLQLLFDQSPIEIIAYKDDQIIYANPASISNSGYQGLDEFMGKNLLDLIHPDQHEKLKNRKDQFFSGKQSMPTTYQVIRKDGKPRWLEVNTISVLIDGSPAILTFGYDISERLQAEQDLKSNEERLKQITDISTDWAYVIDYDLKGNISNIWRSDSAIRLTGYEHDELTQVVKNRTILPPEDRHLFEERLERLQANQEDTSEYRIITKAGETRWIRDHALPIWDKKEKRVVRIYGAAKDITEQKKAEKALQKSEARFRGMFEQAAVGVAEVESKTNKLLRVNQRYIDIIGYSKEELESMDFVQFSHPDDIQEDLDNMARLMAGEIDEYSMEKRIFSSSGETVWINLTVSPLWAPGEEPSRHIAIIEDITERKQAEAELQRTHRSLNDAQRIGKSGNWEWNLQTGEIWWSDGLYNIYDRDPKLGPLENNGLTECVHPDDQNTLIQALADSLISGLYLAEYRTSQSINNNDKIISAVGEVNFDEEGTPLIHRGVARDVTKQRQQEKALHESEIRYSSLFQNSIDTFLFINDQGTVIDANPAACTLFGYQHEELLNLTIADLASPEIIEIFDNNWENYLETGYKSDELEVTTKDGRKLIVRYYVTAHILPGIHFVVAHDITEQEQAEIALQESEEKYRRLFETSTMGIGYYDKDGTIVSFNQVAAERMGGDPDDFIGKKMIDLFPDIGEIYQNRIDQVIHTGQSIEFEDNVPLPTGSKWFLSTYSPVKNEDSESIGVQIISQDITEQKMAEQVLKASEARLRDVLDASPFPVVLVDEQDDEVKYWSQSAQALFGHTAPTAQEWYQLAYPDPDYQNEVLEQWIPAREKAKQTGKQVNAGEYQVTCKDGSVRICELYVAFIADHMIVTFNDITERKQALAALQVSKERFERAMEASADGIFDWNLLTNEIYYSPGWKKMLGYEYDELPNDFSIWENLTEPEDVKRSWEMQQELINKQRDRFEIEFKMRHKDGHWVDILSRATAISDKNDIAVRIVGTHIDITERKQAEKELQESEERFRSLARLAPAGIYLTDADGQCTFVNEKWMEMSGLTMQQAAGDGWINGLHPEDRQYIFDNWNKLIESKGNWGLEYRFKKHKDVTTWVRGVAAPQLDKDGTIIGYIGVNLDITEQKQAEIALRQSEARYRHLVETASDAMYLINADGKFVDTNPTACRMLGKTREEILQLDIYSIDPNFSRDEFLAFWEEIPVGKTHIFETTHLRSNSSEIPVEVSGQKFTIDNNLYFYGLARDITQRKHAEEALKESEHKYRSLVETLHEGIWAIDHEAKTTFVNKSMAEMLGYTPEEMNGKHLFDFMDEQGVAIATANLQNRQQGIAEQHDFEFIRKDGRRIFTTMASAPRIDDNGNYLGAIAGVLDITERKQAEKALQRSEELLNQTGEMALVGGWELDLKTNQVHWTHATRLIHEVPPDYMPQLDTAINFFAPHSRPILAEAIRKAQEDGIPYDLELEFITAKGRKLWTRAIGKPVYENDECTVLRGTFQDITARKQAEAIIHHHQQQLTTLTQRLFTLQEEERLRISRDLHDETGQVLSVVKIYLNLLETKMSSESPELIDDLEKVKDSLNTAHEQIRNLAASLRPSTLDLFGLSKAIEKLCDQIKDETSLNVHLSTEKLPQIPDKAGIALYRVVQEALNNILIHAKANTVNITVKYQNEQIVLNIEDDGIGFAPHNLPKGHSGLGILGMRERIHALKGTLEINAVPGKGTQLTATYPIQENN